jgi:ribosomal protein S18 acetylase RimI-like enzyme
VFKEYRQLGVGRELMAKLHEEMARHYSIDTVNLHCRVSNIPAIRVKDDNEK